jgi:hypothetical protein
MYDKFPRVNYITPQGFKEMTDITVRFDVNQYLIDENALPLNISIRDGERPEMFADRIYGDSNLHWVSLSMNQMINPYYDWMLSTSSFENYLNEKYTGYTIFVTDVNGVDAFGGSFKVNDIVYATGVTNANLQPSILDSLRNGRVVSYDPTYCRLIVEFTQKTAWIPQEGDYIAGASDNKLGQGVYYVGKIGKVIESQYAAHHFENSDGEMLNPRIPASLHNEFLTAADMGFTFGATPIGRYIFEDYTVGLVTNREYEIEENDAKRNILVVPKNRLSNIEKDIENRLA